MRTYIQTHTYKRKRSYRYTYAYISTYLRAYKHNLYTCVNIYT